MNLPVVHTIFLVLLETQSFFGLSECFHVSKVNGKVAVPGKRYTIDLDTASNLRFILYYNASNIMRP